MYFTFTEPELSFTLEEYPVIEGDGQVAVCVQVTMLMAPTEAAILVAISTSDGSAVGKCGCESLI